MKNPEKRLQAIEQRNKKVEIDKAWETSWTRKLSIAILTYVIIVIFFYIAQLPKPFINSIVPTIGFLLSTVTLSLFKKFWVNYYFTKQ